MNVTGIEFYVRRSCPERKWFALLGGGASRWRGVLPAIVTAFVMLALVSASASADECRSLFGGQSPAEPVERTLTLVVLGGNVYGLRECSAEWKIEWSEEEENGKLGPWLGFPGGNGTVTGSAEGSSDHFETGDLSGLEPETTYFERAELVPGEIAFGTFETKLLRPNKLTIEVDPSVVGESSAGVRGQIAPAPFETEWRIEYSTSRSVLEAGGGTLVGEGVISQGEAEALQTATGSNLVFPEAVVSGLLSSSRYFVRLVAEDEPEWPPSSGVKRHKVVVSNIGEFETHGPPVGEAFATPALRLESLRVLGYVVPHGFDTHYLFEYGPTEAYGSKTSLEDAGSGGALGNDASVVGADLPGLLAGGTYHYRLVASSLAGGGTVVDGRDHVLTVPVPAVGSVAGVCPNEALRTGASAGLPACRGYEQVTPVDKEGAEEPFSYAQQVEGGALVGESGGSAMLSQIVTKWGSGQSPYFFSHAAGGGWSMTAGQAQPEAGIYQYEPELVNQDLSKLAFAAQWLTGPDAGSPNVEFKVGSPGGPYRNLVSVPRGQVGESGRSGWVAASGDFSKLILRVEDHNLCGHATGTTSGYDLYEFVEGHCSQVNVKSDSSRIGACGAVMGYGNGHAEGPTAQFTSARDAVSADGSRVFFEAVPGSDCSAQSELYMRVTGGQTVDVGAYGFIAANAAGSKVLIEAHKGEAEEVLLYDTSSGTSRLLLTLHEGLSAAEHLRLTVSEDFSTIYLRSIERLTGEAPPISDPHNINLYRYDVTTGKLDFVVQAETPKEFAVSSDGHYAYWRGIVAGLPSRSEFGEDGILYDGVRNVVECVSCASGLNPEPGLSVAPSYWGGSGVLESRDGTPKLSVLSADGSRVFFDTPSLLLSSDIDGEAVPKGGGPGSWWSSSSDVYEWRRGGVEGCVHVQGCLGLVSSGVGGRLVQLLGADPSGDNVFFTTSESLVSQDTDNAIDFYDARRGGGEAPPVSGPVECEGDSCQSPVSAPIDTTPGSLAFSGPGNVLVSPKPKLRACRKRMVRRKGRCVKVKARHAKRASWRHVKRHKGGGK